MSIAPPEQIKRTDLPDETRRAADLADVRRKARSVLVAERVAVLLSPAASVAGLYCASGFLRIPQTMPDWLHAVVEAGSFGVVVWLGHRGLKQYTPPSRMEVDRRIERVSGLRNRPLGSTTDRSSGVGSDILWRAYQERLLASLGPLRSGWPEFSRLGKNRFLPVVLLACLGTAVWAGSHAPGRLAAAFIPGIDDPDVPLPHVEAWITPPSYAPSAPVFLADGTAHVPAVPEGSVLVSTVTGAQSAPHLKGGFSHETMQALGQHSWRIQAELDRSGSFMVSSRGRTLASWQLTVTPDALPQVAWGQNPGGEKGGRRTRLPYDAHHAYGLGSLVVEIRLAHPGLLTRSRVLTVPLPLKGHPISAKGVAGLDLSDDPWAGEEVSATLVATSVSRKVARSQIATFRLGSRTFKSPVAKAVLDLRRRLALGDENRHAAAEDLAAIGETPGPIDENTGTFLNLTSIVALLDNRDVDDNDARNEAVGRLWDLALDIEDQLHGGKASAQASIDVRAAQEAVSGQLRHMREDNAHGTEEQAELKRRMDALRAAIGRKMQALAEQAMRDGTAIPDLPGLTKSGDRAFQKLMERLQGDAAEGHEDGAMDKLQQLEDSIEKMRNATPQDMAQLAQQMMAQQKLQEQAESLGDLVKQQSSLLDHAQARLDRDQRRRDQSAASQPSSEDSDLGTMSTSELLRRLGLVPPDGMGGPPPQSEEQAPAAQEQAQSSQQPDADKNGQAAAEADQKRSDGAAQHALMRATEELGSEFKELSGKEVPAFGEAGKAMKDARHALTADDDPDAVKAETAALKALQQGRNQMRKALQGKGGGSGSASFLPSFGGGGGQGKEGQPGSGDEENGDQGDGQSSDEQNADRDPLGRSTGEGLDKNPNAGGSLPEKMSRERAQAIEEELRRRDSDRTRPKEELDYLDRLLKSF
ncbi:DUF4175 domain-containing protein [Acetobacter sp.]|jgi:uncharacterized protein (TIGR02302 family)|uniref:DUF4175 domain-containing protein n=1 Tax=Acetobacter sp. TaxID=440 RepID=UPI0025B8F6C4|nr:DUF4175 family protein [Acetobacter sp.]MCH4090533.1 DUF4175 domain-containing protein [Acetobacter sp.]MCI1299227.1 DUF4175 domain-containing protein [Acetobacter sp.]MCI1315774.1 DUF4175 domain-containing protein [Acetobacter sp.]